jgi:hypothetical protein
MHFEENELLVNWEKLKLVNVQQGIEVALNSVNLCALKVSAVKLNFLFQFEADVSWINMVPNVGEVI